MLQSLSAVLIVAAWFAAPVAVVAHDLWLIPPEKSQPNKAVTVRAHSGSEFPKSEHAPDPAKFAIVSLTAPDGTAAKIEIAGTEDLAGLLRFTPDAAGLYVVAVQTTPKLIVLEAAKFNEYLVSDGLPHIFLVRSKEKTLDRPGRERYSKSPKALIRVGDGGKGDAGRVLGLPLKIVPVRDPFALKVGDTLKVRVLFQGKPLADANLGWNLPGDGEAPSGTVRSDKNGEALIPIAHTGLMTTRLTHMTRPNEKDYEWESFWTTLTFRVPD